MHRNIYHINKLLLTSSHNIFFNLCWNILLCFNCHVLIPLTYILKSCIIFTCCCYTFFPKKLINIWLYFFELTLSSILDYIFLYYHHIKEHKYFLTHYESRQNISKARLKPATISLPSRRRSNLWEKKIKICNLSSSSMSV